MTSRFVEYMETLAYFEAISRGCIQPRDSKKIAMPELFDFITGSGTGGIIAGALVVPGNDPQKQINMHFADATSNFFKTNAKKLYTSQEIPVVWQIVITVVFSMIISLIVFACLRSKFNSKKGYSSTVYEIKLFVDFNKKNLIEQKPINMEDRDRIWQLIKTRGDLSLHEIMLSVQTALSKKEK
jgi:hypothetical protein